MNSLSHQEIDVNEIESVLREHPGVREASLAIVGVAQGEEKLVAYVVPDYDCIERTKAGSEEERKRILKYGRLYDLALKARNAEHPQPGRNFLGWNSSYTKQQIPAEEMEEWVDLTVKEILSLHPDEILELGCGSGLLLLRIARGRKRYVGLDISPVSLESVARQMEELEGPWDGVELLERPADNFDGLGEGSFDTVIANSVTQYFLNVNYLTRVLEGAIKSVRPGGAIFIGDVRSLPLQEAFAVSVELFQAQPSALIEDLRARVRRRINQETELVISPAFFEFFQRLSSKISHVELKLKRGQFQNEMNGFRFDAILHVGPDQEKLLEPAWLDAEEENLSLEAIREMLRQRQPDTLGIMRVANARVVKYVEALDRLANAEGSTTVEDFKKELCRAKPRGVDPNALWSLGDELGYQVDMSWASSRKDGSYDVLFRRLAETGQPHRQAVAWPQSADTGGDFGRYVNRPGLIALRQDLVSQLTEHCKSRLPMQSVPASFVIVDSLPEAPESSLDPSKLGPSIGARTSG